MNPCESCGACCTTMRVSFYWGEANDAPGGRVPAEMTVPVTPHLRAMKGTEREPPRCIALEGVVGERVTCSIYELRPSPCREFLCQLEDAESRCNEIRARVGLGRL